MRAITFTSVDTGLNV